MKKKRYLILIVFIISFSKSYAQLNATVIGNAIDQGNNCFTITQDLLNQVGGVWYDNPIDFDEDFTIIYQNNFGSKDGNGADGMALVFKDNSTPQLGNAGGGMGYQGIGSASDLSANASLIIEFDTYQNNTPNEGLLDDPFFDHVAIVRGGNPFHNSISNLAGPVQASSNSINIEDGNTHEIKIEWIAAQTRLNVYFDCELRLSLNQDVKNTVFFGDDSVFFGFVGSTGGLSNIHEVCFNSISFVDNLQIDDQIVCENNTPIFVDAEIPSGLTYSWSPPQFVDFPGNAAVMLSPPLGTTTFTVNIVDICGDPTTESFTVTVLEVDPQPTLECWETATFNDTTCLWEVTGTQPTQPTGLECWQSSVFNNTTCTWDIIGTQPMAPITECWQTAIFNNATCSWDVTGTQPTQPTGLECWQSSVFNNTTCTWDIIGTQPMAPITECWQTAIFNNAICSWDVSGTQPAQPTGLECWENLIFNTTTCSWDVVGTQPTQPILACWETAMFNTATCSWDVSGTQPTQPTGLECWENPIFNTTTCSWDIFGTQPLAPTVACWESTTFNNTACLWEVSGTPPDAPTFNINTIICEGDIVAPLPMISTEGITGSWSPPTINNQQPQQYVFTPDQGQGCQIQTTVDIQILQPVTPTFNLQNPICSGDTDIVLPNSSVEGITGTWSEPLNNTETTTYTFTPNPNQCASSIDVTIEVLPVNELQLSVQLVSEPFSNNQTVVASVTGGDGMYEYQLGNGAWTTENVFSNLRGCDEYTLRVRQTNTCSNVGVLTFRVIDYPKFFTPNGDASNPVWNINCLRDQPNATISIFDRYGKLLATISPRGIGWNGVYNGNLMPTSDYWFTVNYLDADGNPKVFSSHFTLKR